MAEKIKLTNSEVSILEYISPGKFYPKNVLSSENGYLVMHHRDSLEIALIGFHPSSQNKKYILNEQSVEIDFKNPNYPLRVKDFNFQNAIEENKIKGEEIYQLSLNDNYTSFQYDETKDIIRVEWSPLNVVVIRSYLGIQNSNGRIIILGQNQSTNLWQNEFDMLEMYHIFYKGNLLISSCDENGIITCTDINEYIQVKNDLKLISFSWGSLMRQSDHNQYCLIALLSESGIVTVWRIVNEQFKCKCEIIHCFRLDKQCGVPKTIQFCDISNDRYLISVFYSNEKIVAYPYMIISGKDNKISVETFAKIFTINDQLRYSQVNKVCWSMKYKTLIVGYESHILFAKIEFANEHDIGASVYWLELPSDDEISGIAVKESMVYVTARDGLFAIKIDQNLENIEYNEIIFESPELNGNVDFLSVFLSPNAVYLGFVKIDNDQLIKNDEVLLGVSEIVLIKIMPEKELFNILMDDTKPFGRKQDAVKELRHMYSNNGHMLNVAFQKLTKFDIDHEGNTLHNLQLARYLCIFFGYQMNMDSKNNQFDIFKLRKLEIIIISRNISYWLEGFSKLPASDTNKDDCFFVLLVSGKLKLIPHRRDITKAIEAAQSRSRLLLKMEFGISPIEIEKFEQKIKIDNCPVCGDKFNFNLLSCACLKNHSFPRCCKSLKLCNGNVKVCRMCGAAASEKVSYANGMSNWRLGIINSNCPLCDCKFV